MKSLDNMQDQEDQPPLVALHDAGLQRQSRWLVESLTFNVHRGEIVSLIGPNGAGKTTTVRLMLGIDKPTRGTVRKISGLTIGYVPQKLAIDTTLPLKVHHFMGTGGHVPEDLRRQALDDLQVAHLWSASVGQLSGGEFQRVMLARAIARRPDLLVLDEPAQGVDIAGEIDLYERIADIRDRHQCGILLVSHNLHVVMKKTDKVICMQHHICCSGSPSQVAGSTEFKALFGDRAAEVLAIYPHHHDHHHASDGSLPHDH